MSTGMNFTCISAFDASKDIIWSFSYKFESDNGVLGNCGFTTFLNFLSSQTKGGINSGLGYGPYDDGVDIYEGAKENFLAISFENAGTFALAKNGFSTGISEPIFNSITVRKNNDFEYIGTKQVNFNILSNKWQTLRFQLTNLGHTLNIFHCDENFNYNKIATFETSDIFYISQQLYAGISFATPIDGSSNFKLRIKNFHFYGQIPNILPPAIEEQTEEEYLIFGNTVLLSAKVVGARPISFEWYKDNLYIESASSTFYNAFETGTYKLKTYNPAGYALSKNIYVRDAIEPSIVIDLDPIYTIPAGSDNIVLSVSAIGAPVPYYKWYKNNVLIQKSSKNSITAVGDGNYVVVAYNKFNEVSSTVAAVRLTPPTIMGIDPVSGMAPLIFTVSADGSIPMTYQWYKNDLIIPGATDSAYLALDMGVYKVEATNSGGFAMSYPLSAFEELKFIRDLETVDMGTPMTVSVIGNEPILYTWYNNGIEIGGVTTNSYTPTTPGTYKVIATNLIDQITSAEVPIYAIPPARIRDFISPGCIDTLIPINPEDNKYTLEFDKVVSLNLINLNDALSAAGLSAAKINSISPSDGAGRFKRFEISTIPISQRYGVVESGIISDLTPDTELIEIPIKSNFVNLDLPFKIYDPFWESYFSKIFVGVNGSIVLGLPGSVGAISRVSRTNGRVFPNINRSSTIYSNVHENSKINSVATTTKNTSDGKIFIVKIKLNYASQKGPLNIFEVIFYEKYPKKFTIKTDPTNWNTYTTKSMIGLSVYARKDNHILSKFELKKGSFITVNDAIVLNLPPKLAKDENGDDNIDTFSIITKPCTTELRQVSEIFASEGIVTSMNVNAKGDKIILGRGMDPYPEGDWSDLIVKDRSGTITLYENVAGLWKEFQVARGDTKMAQLGFDREALSMSDDGNVIIGAQENNANLESHSDEKKPHYKSHTIKIFEKNTSGDFINVFFINTGTYSEEDIIYTYDKDGNPIENYYKYNNPNPIYSILMHPFGNYMILYRQIGTKNWGYAGVTDTENKYSVYEKKDNKWKPKFDSDTSMRFLGSSNKIIRKYGNKFEIFDIENQSNKSIIEDKIIHRAFSNSSGNIIGTINIENTSSKLLKIVIYKNEENEWKKILKPLFITYKDSNILHSGFNSSISEDGNTVALIFKESISIYKNTGDGTLSQSHSIGLGDFPGYVSASFLQAHLNDTGNLITVKWGNRVKQFKLL